MHKGSFNRPRRGYVGLTIKVPSKSPKRTTVTTVRVTTRV